MAAALDYIFLVKLLNATGYCKLDVYIYYLLTCAMPIVVGRYKFNKTKTSSRKWKIDIWLMKSMDNVSDRFMKKISQGLDEKERDTILKFKKIIKEWQIDFPSFVIYEAVVMDEVFDMRKLSIYAN